MTALSPETATGAARRAIEARIGRSLLPLRDQPQDIRTAIKLLAIAHIRAKEAMK